MHVYTTLLLALVLLRKERVDCPRTLDTMMQARSRARKRVVVVVLARRIAQLETAALKSVTLFLHDSMGCGLCSSLVLPILVADSDGSFLQGHVRLLPTCK